MKSKVLWIAALVAVSAGSFYAGYCRAYSQVLDSSFISGLTRHRIELLKAGHNAEALALETKIMDAEVASTRRRPFEFISPLAILSRSPDPNHRGVLLAARDTHYRYPDLAFQPETLAAIWKFEEKEPYSFGSPRH